MRPVAECKEFQAWSFLILVATGVLDSAAFPSNSVWQYRWSIAKPKKLTEVVGSRVFTEALLYKHDLLSKYPVLVFSRNRGQTEMVYPDTSPQIHLM